MRETALLFYAAAVLCLAAAAAGVAAADDTAADIEDIALPRAGLESSNFFYVKAIDGQPVDNLSNYSREIAEHALHRWEKVHPVADRDISIAAHTVTIAARNVSEHPIRLFRLFGGSDEVSGDVTLTPQPGHKYRVTGEIDDHQTAIWIIDVADGSVATSKIERPS
ncbi:MAG: hypothetical protein ACREHE_04370 [Rhizomicrobium sp.]